MPALVTASLEPRKTPVQARAAVSVESILEATLQVLLEVGQTKLTTTRVATRAGVSVGTLYQYFPNKNALLNTVLERHLNGISETIAAACTDLSGESLDLMAEGMVRAFLRLKLDNLRRSVALYAFSYDVGRGRIVRTTTKRNCSLIAAMLRTAPQPLRTDPELAAEMLVDIMAGVSRRIVESALPRQHVEAIQHELIVAAKAYLSACQK